MMNDEEYRDGFKPKKRLGKILKKRFRRTVVMLSDDQREWLAKRAAATDSSASAVLRSLINSAMKDENGGRIE